MATLSVPCTAFSVIPQDLSSLQRERQKKKFSSDLKAQHFPKTQLLPSGIFFFKEISIYFQRTLWFQDVDLPQLP